MGKNIGGAQYIVKNTTPAFWEKVENDSIKLYRYFCDVEPHYVKKHDGDYPIQKWTAGMWSYVWNAWLAGYEMHVDSKLHFGWCTDPYDVVTAHSILHNAGVTSVNDGLFYKGAYTNSLPYGVELNVLERRASHFYWEAVKEAAKVSPLTNKTNLEC